MTINHRPRHSASHDSRRPDRVSMAVLFAAIVGIILCLMGVVIDGSSPVVVLLPLTAAVMAIARIWGE